MTDDEAELRAVLRRVLHLREALERDNAELRARQRMLVELLQQRGVLSAGQAQLIERAADKAQAAARPRVHLAVVGDKYAMQSPDVDCVALMPLCKGRCCAFRFELSEQDLNEGVVRWTLDDPYLNAQERDGYCTHVDRETQACTVYDKRPYHCRAYDCRKDARVWVDFEARLPAGMPNGIAMLPAAAKRRA